ncbi:hypothetical protein Q7P35_006675 [Cladosporium inversicolor]
MARCHIGFANYYCCWENQKKIRRWETHGLAHDYFFEAPERLPKLRNLAHSDYRALAYNGESYAHLCQRLFGHTVCPAFSNIERVSEDTETDEDYRQSYHRRLQTFLEDVSRVSRTWDSISIGRHPFETNHHDFYDRFISPVSGRKNVELRYDALFSKFGKDQRMNVRSLKLPILAFDQDSITKYGGLSNLVADSVLELEVREFKFSRHWHRFKKSPPHLQSSGLGESFGRLLHSAGDMNTLRNLRSLTLRGFIFPTDGLRMLLLDPTPALRTLRLIDCLCTDGYRHFSNALQTTIEPATKLHGVEVFDLRFKQLEGETEDNEHAQEYREKPRARHAREYERYQDGRNPYLEGLLLSDWPYELPKLEIALLGGRDNAISRKMYAAPNDDARCNWQELPNSLT